MESSENKSVGASVRGHAVHDPNCQTPLSEHTGTEPCITYQEEVDEIVQRPVVAHYKQGPQGNLVADHYADALARYGPYTHTGPIGTPEIKDRRDNSDPAVVGAAFLARNNGSPA